MTQPSVDLFKGSFQCGHIRLWPSSPRGYIESAVIESLSQTALGNFQAGSRPRFKRRSAPLDAEPIPSYFLGAVLAKGGREIGGE